MSATGPADPSTRDEPLVRVAHKGLLTIAVMAAMLMQILDSTIANVALPHMQASLGATQDSVSWVLTSYILATAIAMPAAGWLSDRIGLRQLFLASVVIFVAASALCGLATNLVQMVFFRLLQGLGGAFLAPLTQTILLNTNKPSEHPKTMSTYGLGIMIGPIAGPILGGWLTENFDWRWVFFVNLPLGAAALAGLWLLLPRMPAQKRRFDLVGWALIAVALASFQLMLDRGQHVDWFSATEIWIEAGVTVGALWMFVIHLLTSPTPLFPSAVLSDRNFMTGVMFMFVMGLVMMSAMALLPSLLQELFGYSVIDTGILLASRGIGVVLTMQIASKLNEKVDPRVLVGLGFSVTSASLWMMTGWSLEMGWQPFIISGFIQGLGFGFIFVPLNLLSFATLAPQYRTDASSLFNLMRNMGASVGIAIMTALLARNIQVSHADVAAAVTPYSLPVDPTISQRFGSMGDSLISMLDGMVNQQAAFIAYLDDFRFMMFATLLALPMLLLLKKPRGGAGGSPPVHVD